jgi:hypothetical protein
MPENETAATTAVHKFPLTGGVNLLKMSFAAKLLHVHVQHDDVCLWAEVDLRGGPSDRYVRVLATGEAWDGRGVYVGTAHVGGGGWPHLVFHVYDLGVTP